MRQGSASVNMNLKSKLSLVIPSLSHGHDRSNGFLTPMGLPHRALKKQAHQHVEGTRANS